MYIEENIKEVRENIKKTAEKIDKNPDEISLIAVTKLHSPEEINEAIDCGITDIGENKVQEILEKYDKIKKVNWHLIGHLQRNKVKYIINKVSMIHSVDSLKLAEEIDKRANKLGITMDILIQVNTSKEESKFGVDPIYLENIITDIAESCPNIRIRGLMCIAPMVEDLEDARPAFSLGKKLFDEYKNDSRSSIDFKYLSMGMTGDYMVAIEEGSNMVRVGTGIFGKRDYRSEEK